MAPASNLPTPIHAAHRHPDRTAILDAEGPHQYRDLIDASARVASALRDGSPGLRGARVAYRLEPGFGHVAVQWGIWRAGGIAVPLARSHPVPELRHVIEDAGASVVVGHPDDPVLADLRAAGPGLAPRWTTDGTLLSGHPDTTGPTSTETALLIYTSGTTGKPKGVVVTHRALDAQVASLTDAWAWTADDRTRLVLPLHHVHGLVNVVCCALWNGARCSMPAGFDPTETWNALDDLTVFMAVPTIWRRLIDTFDAADADTRRRWAEAAAQLRLGVSGSAALPPRLFERWREISGHPPLERYGMTEIGMALSNPLHGERRAGTVGHPLPGVSVRLVDDEGAAVPDGSDGHLEVRGPTVFSAYWNRPEDTRAAFRDGWFHTGDTAVVEDGYYRLLGRTSVDILKSGGYKISALEIEAALAGCPGVATCAVVGLPDDEWGQRVAVAIEPETGAPPTLETVQAWARERVAAYKIPRALLIMDRLPRNALGKVMKPEIVRCFAEQRA